VTVPDQQAPVIAVLGASGMIGAQIAADLIQDGWSVAPFARRFTAAQRQAFGEAAVELPFVSLDPPLLARLLAEADIVINCVGVLQDGGGDRADDAHRAFVARLVEAIASLERPVLLIHFSIPGDPDDDSTPFSRTKRTAEWLIAESGAPHVVLRPGFVVSPVAYGGGALLRALAMSRFGLPPRTASRPFASVDIADVCATIQFAVSRWREGARDWTAAWDLMAPRPETVGETIEAFRAWLGGPRPIARLPEYLLEIGSRAGDVASWLGWRPPIRSTALAELRRGVTGDPQAWIEATGIEPRSFGASLARLPASIQERWFARLYLLKALILVFLVAWWLVPAALAAALCLSTNMEIALWRRGFLTPEAIAASLAAAAIAGAIAWRRTCRWGLIGGLVFQFATVVYAAWMAQAAEPHLWIWIELPRFALRTAPIAVLMLVALALLDDR
jgi:uncharacterized protein YbjT (DUF2867 family)